MAKRPSLPELENLFEIIVERPFKSHRTTNRKDNDLTRTVPLELREPYTFVRTLTVMDTKSFNNAIAFAATVHTTVEDPDPSNTRVGVELPGQQELMDMAGALAILFNFVVEHSSRKAGVGYDEAVAQIADVLKQKGLMD